MPSTTSFNAALDDTDWTLLAAGASNSAATVRAAGPLATKIAVAATKPAVDETDWTMLTEGQELALTLNGDNLYGMAAKTQSYVSGVLLGS